MKPTKEQLQTLRHMLGIDVAHKRNPEEYRNYYCAPHNCAELHELESLGMVRAYDKCEHYEWFTATDAGKAAARWSQREMLEPKAKRMYSAFLHIADCRPDMTFRDFLTAPDLHDYRASI